MTRSRSLSGRSRAEAIGRQISAVKGQLCAIVMTTPLDEDHKDVVPELIVEDAMRVLNHGWPEGFKVEILSQSA